MKNNFIVLAAIIAIGLSANCQGIKIPAVVKTTFTTMFPGATGVEWGKENAREYEAEFKFNNNAVSANFGTDGKWIETETVIPLTDLPAVVKEGVERKYPGAIITMAEKLEMPVDKLLYEVGFTINGKKKSLELNSDGTLAK